MPTLGNKPSTWSTFSFSQLNTENVVTGPLVTMPSPGGTVTDMGIYVSGYSGSVAVQAAIWNSAGQLVFATNQVTVPAGTAAVGGQAWQTFTGLSYWLAPGNYYLGWWRAPGGTSEWSLTAGTYYTGATPGSSGAGSLPTMTTQSGDPGAYLDYTSTTYPYNQIAPYWIIRWNAHPH